MGIAIRRSRRQAAEHAAHWAHPEPGTLTYVALGDSTAVGVGVEDPRQGYVSIIARRLAHATGESVRTVNLAVSGARAQDVLDGQVPQLSTMDPPDLVTCLVGGNDVAWAPRFRTRRFARTMRTIAEHLPNDSVMGLVPHVVHWPFLARAARANRAIRTAALAGGHTVADIHTATKALPLSRYLQTFAGDYFHPAEAGHRLWAEVAWQQSSLSREEFRSRRPGCDPSAGAQGPGSPR